MKGDKNMKIKFLENLKAKRKAKKEETADYYYDKQEKELLKAMDAMEDKNSEAFEKLQAKLKNINIMRAESKESKRRISKQDRGGIIIKVLGIFGAAAGVGSIIWAEHEGMTFTGEKRSIMDSICRGIGNIFVRK